MRDKTLSEGPWLHKQLVLDKRRAFAYPCKTIMKSASETQICEYRLRANGWELLGITGLTIKLPGPPGGESITVEIWSKSYPPGKARESATRAPLRLILIGAGGSNRGIFWELHDESEFLRRIQE